MELEGLVWPRVLKPIKSPKGWPAAFMARVPPTRHQMDRLYTSGEWYWSKYCASLLVQHKQDATAD